MGKKKKKKKYPTQKNQNKWKPTPKPHCLAVFKTVSIAKSNMMASTAICNIWVFLTDSVTTLLNYNITPVNNALTNSVLSIHLTVYIALEYLLAKHSL